MTLESLRWRRVAATMCAASLGAVSLGGTVKGPTPTPAKAVPAARATAPAPPPRATPTPGPDLRGGEALGTLILDGHTVPLRHAFSWRMRGWDPSTNKPGFIWVVVITEEPVPWETLSPPTRYQELVTRGEVRGLEVTLAGGRVVYASVMHESLLFRGGSLMAEGRHRVNATRWDDRVVSGQLSAPDSFFAGSRFQYDVFFKALVRNEVNESR